MLGKVLRERHGGTTLKTCEGLQIQQKNRLKNGFLGHPIETWPGKPSIISPE
jgi:hypothetical protein